MFDALVKKSSTMFSALALFAAAAVGGPAHDLRVQKDAARDRGWLLTRSGVVVLDLRTRQTVAEVSLPGWLWAKEQFLCPPDLAIGPNGEALISSNVTPTLWRVDPVSFAVTRHAPVLDAHADKDVGFTGLVFSEAHGAFYAVSHFGALWRIDALLARAQKVDLSEPVQGACGVSVRGTKSRFNRFFGLCVRGQESERTINLTPDRRSGYVIAQPCPA
jgi:hypothetical protein